MLLELSIENFVLIEKAVLEFSSGFNVITGETGAGKSLAVQALKLLLGARAESRLVRPGAKQAVVQAMFTLDDRTAGLLDDRGIDAGEELIVRRIIPVSGKGGRIYINGALVSLADLREITADLVSISSQHEYQTLLRQGSHRVWLDRFAGIEAEVEETARLHSELGRISTELERLLQKREELADERERLHHEAELIDSVDPSPGEVDEIEQELAVLRSAKDLRLRGENIYTMIYAGKGSVTEVLSEGEQELERMTRMDSRLDKSLEDMQSLRFQAEELAWRIRDYVQELPSDLTRLEQLEERLYAIRQLERRFGPSTEDVLNYRRELEKRLEQASNLSDRIAEAETALDDVSRRLIRQATLVSKLRQQAASELASSVLAELKDLKLDKTSFTVNVSCPDEPDAADAGPAGFDTVNFLFSANIGQEAAPLSRIASGGELSRVMLALKAVLARKSGIETVIFDELDSGISGEVADMVGAKLAKLAEHGQVIAITHYPQIAAAARLHITVIKNVENGLTTTVMKELEEEERIDEIARMLGGGTEDARAWAARLLGPVFRRT